MSGLFIARSNASTVSTDVMLEAARSQFSAHGFGAPSSLDIPGWSVLHWQPAIGGPSNLLVSGDDFIAIAGTLIYDGLIGDEALRRLLDSIRLPDIDWSRIGGEFTAFVHKQGKSFVFCDFFAAHQTFHDSDAQFLSTSFLAATGSIPRLSFDPQGLYEYAFNAATVGDDTVIAGLKMLGPDRVIELTADGIRSHFLRKTLPDRVSHEPLAERVATHRDRLLATFAPFTRYFGDHIFCPLSGGLDSRLVLAALRASGKTPHVYVYGRAGDHDVEIARRIGASQGFAVECIDKGAMGPPDPEHFAELVKRNYEQWDALPNYGNIFDDGGNLKAQNARHAGGALAISGGCGEVFRDFFFLPDRNLSAKSVARTFFARVRLDDATASFDYRAFVTRLGEKIAAALNVDNADRPLPRTTIEQIYPRVRCRALFGREISHESRLGAYAMPFIDHQVVAAALTVPMKLKWAGRFEAMLLNAIDPSLAAEPSAYGHHFAGPPNARHQVQEWSSRVRPVWLREKSYAIQRRLRPMSDQHGGLLSPEYMGRVIDLDFPAMRRFFQVDRINDSGLWRRVAALEYLAARLGSRLQN